MSPPVAYLPAYVGLYAALVLAAACNTFLDIRYGGFLIENLLWGGLFAWTLRVGWRQQGAESAQGRRRQKAVLIVGALVSVFILFPIWGQRAGVYVLAMLQASNNCVTTTRRRLYLGLLVSLVMVMFAATHHRADWTMLFYLLPYVAAVVFTLVAEQISRRAQDLADFGAVSARVGGQSVSIVSATAAILAIAALLYAITPQISLPYLTWRFGQPTDLGYVGGVDPGQSGTAPGGAGGGVGHGANGAPAGGGLPSVAEMRDAAGRVGMPQWQSSAITRMAEVAESLKRVSAPVMQSLGRLWQGLLDALEAHWRDVMRALPVLIALALLVAAILLWRESRPGVWLGVWLDYVRFGLFAMHARGGAGGLQYFRAFERLLVLHDVERPAAANTREYLLMLGQRHAHLRRQFAELVLLYEQVRYGAGPVDDAVVARMRTLYRTIFWKVGDIAISGDAGR